MAQALIDGLSSATDVTDAPRGWNAVVKPQLHVTDVSLVDNVTLTITLGQFASYAIDEPETLTLVLPPQLVRSVGSHMTAHPSRVITAPPGKA